MNDEFGEPLYERSYQLEKDTKKKLVRPYADDMPNEQFANLMRSITPLQHTQQLFGRSWLED